MAFRKNQISCLEVDDMLPNCVDSSPSQLMDCLQAITWKCQDFLSSDLQEKLIAYAVVDYGYQQFL